MKSLLSIRLRQDEFEDALYRETHLFSFASCDAVRLFLKTSANLKQVFRRGLTCWHRQVLVESDVMLEVSVSILMGDRKEDPASVSALQKRSVHDDDAAAICHR